jgi:hypothetical protein
LEAVELVRTGQHRYEKTQMAVSHYEEMYGDTRLESVRAEFGEAVAAALLVEGWFTPLAHAKLVTEAEAMVRQGANLLEVLEFVLGGLREAAY